MIKKGESGEQEAKLAEQKHKEMNELIGLNNIEVKNKPTLLISSWCAEHIRTLHKEYPNTEWLAYCKVEPQGNGVFLMTDMVFPGQTTTSGDVETTKEGMEWLNKELIARGEKATDWNCVLHSHHHMTCFWSGTDDNARKNLNDGRQLAWAVVTAYNDKGVDYKGCINFYKPYNIEIDAIVKNAEEQTIADKYNEYLKKVAESETIYYEHLLEENKEYIDSITNKPSYNRLLDYLGLDITEELDKNYDDLKDKIGNPELLEYLNKLASISNELALTEVNRREEYQDMLVEYGEFCNWSDNLLSQLEKNKERTTYGTQAQLITSQTSYPTNSNRDFEDYDYEFTSPQYAESYIRAMFGISPTTPMRVGDENEWQVWSYVFRDYVYVEERANEEWYY